MPTLSVPVYGGRTFERDNDICDNVNTMKVTLHGGLFTVDLSEKIGPLPPAQPPPRLTVSSAAVVAQPPPMLTVSSAAAVPVTTQPKSDQPPPSPQNQALPPSQVCTPVLMKEKTSLLPQGLYPIPCKQPPGSKVIVLPPSTLDQSTSLWPPQICDVAAGCALYINQTESPLQHAKHTHFRVINMEEQPVIRPISCPVNLLAITSQSPSSRRSRRTSR